MDAQAPLLYVEARVFGCVAELYLNDVPLVRLRPGDVSAAQIPAAPYLFDGENELSLLVCPGPKPSLARKEPEQASGVGMSAWARIVGYVEDEFMTEDAGEKLAEVRWTGEAEELLPRELATTVDLGPQHGPWAFQHADPLELDAPTMLAVTALIERIRTAFGSGQPDFILGLARTKHAELERAFPAYSPGTMDKEFARWVRTGAADEVRWKLLPVEREAYDLRLCARGKLVECIARDWKPIIRTEVVDGDSVDYPVMLGRTQGQWQILR